MAELLNAACAQGRLVVTDTHIIVERGSLTSASMPRAAFTGLDARMTLWFFGWTRYNLVFRGQGSERIKAGNVSKSTVKAVQRLLTGR